MRPRVGIGYDSHAFGAQRPLILGGVEIPHDSGLVGHSDGDAVCHAITDALLGAAAMGNIGQLFPDSDDRWKDADSMSLLKDVRRRIEAASYEIVNVDVTVVTEKPKLNPYVLDMREKLSAALGVALSDVSVKGKTNEGLDDVGAGRGLVAMAVASIIGD